MKSILVAGAGKIGTMVAALLAESASYKVFLADTNLRGADIQRLNKEQANLQLAQFDLTDERQFAAFIQEHPVSAVVSCLPYYVNVRIAQLAKEFHLHYFDLTEDRNTTNQIQALAADAKTAFVPQCGLAPGFISIAATTLIREFDEVDSAHLRVGALPQNASNALQYALTWSTDGLINEYGNPCHVIDNGVETIHQPLEGLEQIQIDGLAYEAFNTSGGLGSLVSICAGKVKNLNYKTIRYPGHCEKIRVLMNDLRLNDDRDTLKRILENSIPKTYQDVVLVYVTVTGRKNGILLEKNYMKKIYPRELFGIHWSAIQLTTASGICVVVDSVLENQTRYAGHVLPETFTLEEFLKNRFGEIYR